MSNPLMGYPRSFPVDEVEHYALVSRDDRNTAVWVTVERCEADGLVEPFGMNYPDWQAAAYAAHVQRPQLKLVVRF